MADGQREYLQGVIEFYRTRTGTKMAIAAERLAVIAAVTLPVTALSSIMGMNVIVNDHDAGGTARAAAGRHARDVGGPAGVDAAQGLVVARPAHRVTALSAGGSECRPGRSTVRGRTPVASAHVSHAPLPRRHGRVLQHEAHSRTTGTADTLIEVGRFLLEARAASRRAAVASRNPSPSPGARVARRRTPSDDRLRSPARHPGEG